MAFSNQQSYIAAISARFVQLQHGDIDKRVEVKPYVLDDQMCDECQGSRCGGKFAPFFCANVTCLQVFKFNSIYVYSKQLVSIEYSTKTVSVSFFTQTSTTVNIAGQQSIRDRVVNITSHS